MKEIKYIIYGAGMWGKAYLDFLKQLNLDRLIIGFCDKRCEEIKQVSGKQVLSYEDAKKLGERFIVAVKDQTARNEIYSMMDSDGVLYCSMEQIAESEHMDRVRFNREFCAFFHMDNMDQYFESAESKRNLEIFWGENSIFLKMFSGLNLENVIELACGRGRHVMQYFDIAGKITLVDILQKNIDYCKERFKEKSNITYYRNDGYDLKELPDNAYTSLFSYDAMVHFEMMDIYGYLVDIYRVLVPGGKALIHHPNYDTDYKASFENSVNGRSFMSKKLFAYLAYRAGFEILRQEVIDWTEKDLDCITLLQKHIER